MRTLAIGAAAGLWLMGMAGHAAEPGKYLVVDLSAGAKAAKYPTAWLKDCPADLLTNKEAPDGKNKYKTTHIVFRHIPAGEFEMGLQGSKDTPAHKVKISKDFLVGVFEVTRAQMLNIVGRDESDTGDSVECPSEGMDRSFFAGSARVLAKKIGMTAELPTEAQWEYAARAGTTNASYAANLDEIAWHQGNAKGKTNPVGLKKPNAWGLYDMYGNVWESCREAFAPYATEAVSDPVGPISGATYVIRGGSSRRTADKCNSYAREQITATSRGGNEIGARIAIEIPAGE